MKKLLLIFTIFLVITSVLALPDLTVDNVQVSLVDPAIADSNSLFTIDMSNDGDLAANMFDYTISVNGEVKATRTIPTFSAGASTTHNVELYFNQSADYDIEVIIDSGDDISESDETNNNFSITVTADTQALNLSMANVAVSGVKGATATSYFNLQNTGNDEITGISLTSSSLSGSSTISSSAVTLIPSTTNLAVGQIKSVQAVVSIPSSAAEGSYTGTLTATYDSGKTETSTLTLNVVPPTSDFEIEESELEMQGDWDDSLSETFTVTNTGSSIASLNISETISGIDLDFDATEFTLAAGASKTVTVSYDVPSDIDAVTYEGNIKVQSADNTETLPAKVIINSMLKIDEVTLIINDDDQEIDDGDSEDISPDDEIELEVIVENLFDEDDDDDRIRNIEVKVEIDGDNWDESEDESVGSLNGEEKNDDSDEIAKFSFTVDDEVEDGEEYELKITVTGEDENDLEHEVIMTATLQVEKDDDEISFTIFRASPSEISCGDTYFELEVRVKNTGSNDQDNIDLDITSSDLNIDISEDNIDLDEGDDWEETYRINIDSGDAGSHTIEIKAENDDVEETDDIRVTIESCGSDDNDDDSTAGSADQDASSNNAPDGIGVIGSDSAAGSGKGGAAIAEHVEEVDWGSIALVTIMVLAIFGFIGLGVFLVLTYW